MYRIHYAGERGSTHIESRDLMDTELVSHPLLHRRMKVLPQVHPANPSEVPPGDPKAAILDTPRRTPGRPLGMAVDMEEGQNHLPCRLKTAKHITMLD